MKLRNCSNVRSVSPNSTKQVKLDNSVKKPSSAPEKPTFIVRKLSTSKTNDDTESNVTVVVSSSELPSSSSYISIVKNKAKETQVNDSISSKVTKDVSKTKKVCELKLDSEEEEEDSDTLKTLMEDLDKGLNSVEDTKKSQSLIDELMSDILENEDNLEKSGVDVENGSATDESAIKCASNQKNKSQKDSISSSGSAVDAKSKLRSAQQNCSENAEEAPKKDIKSEHSEKSTTQSADIDALKKDKDVSTSAKSTSLNKPSDAELQVGFNGEPAKKCSLEDDSKSAKKNASEKCEEMSKQLVTSSSNSGDEVNKDDSEVNVVNSTKSACDENVVSNSVSNKASADRVLAISDDEDDNDNDVMEITVSTVVDNIEIPSTTDEPVKTVANASKRPKTLVEYLTEPACKRPKIDETIGSNGISKLESYLTRGTESMKPPDEDSTPSNSLAPRKEKNYRLTKSEFEMLVVGKVTEYFNDGHNSEIGNLRKRCESLEKTLEQWRRKATTYQKQVTDLQIAVQRVQIKRQNPKVDALFNQPSMRSVGLQVNMMKDAIKIGNTLNSSGKQTVVIPSSMMKNPTLVLPKQPHNGQMTFFTSLGTHGALSNATIVSNSVKTMTASQTGIGCSQTASSSSTSSILQSKLAQKSAMTLSSSEPPVPMRLVQNQAVRQATPTSVICSSTTSSTPSMTVSVVNQNPLVKCIDLTGEEEQQKAAAAVSTMTTVGQKRLVAKPITTTANLPATLAVFPSASTNTMTVLSAASGNNGPLLAINPGTTLGSLVSAVGSQNAVGVTTAIRGSTPSPVAAGSVRLTYLIPSGTSIPGTGLMVRPGANGSPVFVTTASTLGNRPIHSGNQPGLRSPVSPALILRPGPTILPVQNGQNQTNTLRHIQPIQSTRIIHTTKNGLLGSSSNTITTTATITPASAAVAAKTASSSFKAPASSIKSALISTAPTTLPTKSVNSKNSHPAPLPPRTINYREVPGGKLPPPKPLLKLSKADHGIVLSWNMNLTDSYAQISSYQLFAYQESSLPPNSSIWKKVGDVRALPLPMACTLTQFVEGHKYYFAVGAVDAHNRQGPFSDPGSITLQSSKTTAKKT